MTFPPVNYFRLYRELVDAGLPVVSVNDQGELAFSRGLSTAEQSTVDDVLAAHDPIIIPEPTPEERLDALEDALFDLLILFTSR